MRFLSFRLIGRRGADIKLEVPVGITVIDEEKGKVIGKKKFKTFKIPYFNFHSTISAELNKEGSTCVGAAGGGGGCTGTNWIGKAGKNVTIKLDLKLIADVGLVGFPNGT